ncbi:LacI family DNA-binding transcriptional regulator [Pseudoduganella namucuonensis]|uniref:Transcriptional regulator, LacI family n=1 Tax=Pseudoduganella namucuonensis TaxID=1035707 RepID=A0A1I7H9W2_9BURK|nr:LacI family DNA-binding transcriptional regulator [Pseudoduganella namucuonensis]SFU57464.1 transcriptional regulator, LacI family [Pseudoduganella namucuonensis]
MSTSKTAPAPGIAEHKAAILRENRRVTSYDVALVAGVSQSAVSRCFKPGASVSKATYARVMKAAAGLDYIPNAAARSLITRRTNVVAVIISHVANLCHPEALSELSQQMGRHGKRLLLFTLQDEADAERALSEVWQYQVDGVIAVTTLTDAQIAEFERRRMPLVVFNRRVRGQVVNTVACDQYEAGHTLAARLAAAGHRSFGIIDGVENNAAPSARRRGASDKLAELGLPAPVIARGQYDYASGARGLREIIGHLGRTPDVVLCGSDIMAIGCLDCARHELGLAVPEQMSVAGFDAVEPSSWLSYNLTTLRQPIQKMAMAAAELLTKLMDSREGEAEKRMFSALFIEGSTARLLPPPNVFLAA